MLPFPLMVECPDNPFAQFIHLVLQPWFKNKKNWSSGTPQAIAMRFVESDTFKQVAEAFERRQSLVWAVKQGRCTGVFCHKQVKAFVFYSTSDLYLTKIITASVH